jgi:uncharacterized damage-inducible protein DinB
MTYTSLDEVVKDIQAEAALTEKVLDALTDASLSGNPIAPGYRSIGQIAWHLAGAYNAFFEEAGLQFKGMEHGAPLPASAKAIADTYRTVTAAVIAAIGSQWTDATLQERRKLWGFMELSVPGVITLFIRHQIHHRGQLTVMMRHAGIQSPGVYGPNREESAAMGH